MVRRWRVVLLAALATVAVSSFPIDAQESIAVPTTHDRIRHEAKEAPLALRFQGSTPAEATRWQTEFSAKLRSLLGPHSPPQRWQVKLEQRTELETHIREDVILFADGLAPVPVAVLIPRDLAKRRAAGVLALHGHGPDGHLAIARGQAGLQLVRAGYVVVAPCLTPFGRRLDAPERYGKQDPCAVTFIRLQLLGKVLIAENLRDCLWAFEYLRSRPEVDPDRLACVGLSYGGRMSMLTAALEPRLKAAVVSGALNVMQERVLQRYSCGAQVIPGLLQVGDVPEIGALIAPRPCVWEAGLKDTLIDPAWAEMALTRMRKVYQAQGAEGNLHVDRFEGGHTWSWRVALPVLEKALAATPPNSP